MGGKKQVKEKRGEKKRQSESDRKRTERKKKREQGRGGRYNDKLDVLMIQDTHQDKLDLVKPACKTAVTFKTMEKEEKIR